MGSPSSETASHIYILPGISELSLQGKNNNKKGHREKKKI